VTRLLDSLGKRPRVAKTQQAILRLAEVRPMSPQELADHLGLKDVGKLVERHLSPMVADGRLSRTHPDNPSHPNQQYTTTQATIGGEPE
jgi:predicted ArsR family transcriptional regulator